MSSGRLGLAVVVLLALAGVAASLVALSSRGAQAGFLFRQQHPLKVQARSVERVVRTAPEPVAGPKRGGRSARCAPGSARGLRNPWRCVVRYASGRRVRLIVRVRDDGSYRGRYRPGPATAEGCCVPVPGS